MHDFNPIGFYPIGMILDDTLPSTVLSTVPVYNTLNYTLEMFPSGGTRVAAAQIGFTTLPGDTLSNYIFDGTLVVGLTFHRAIYDSVKLGNMSIGYGTLELLNGAGDYDLVYQNNSIAGGRILIKAGWVDVSGPTPIPYTYDGYAVILDGFAQDWHLTDNTLQVTVQDPAFKLNVAASPNVYGGTGGVDGTVDMAGKRKPRALGDLIPDPASGSGGNVSPAFIDPANLVFQVNDGPVLSIPNVYDSGYALTATTDYGSYAALIAATGPDGSYATCLTLGLFRCFAAPYGLITCDVRGDISGTGFISDTASIARRFIQSSLVSAVDEGAFLAVTAAQPAAVGYYLGLDENKNIRQVLDDLFGGIWGWCNFRRDGTLDCGVIAAPAATAVASFGITDVLLGSVQKIDLPTDTNPPPYRVRVVGPRNWTVQTTIVAGVSPTRAAMLVNPFAVGASTNSVLSAAIQAQYNNLGQDPDPIEAYFKLNADAVTEANRRLSLLGSVTRTMYSFRVKSTGFSLRIGDTISLTYPRFDLASGKLMLVVGLSDDTTKGEVEVTVWG